MAPTPGRSGKATRLRATTRALYRVLLAVLMAFPLLFDVLWSQPQAANLKD